MSITHFCFVVGGLAALLGMSLGIVMAVSHDFSLTPVHAHLNLLGWVTMALYGLYYRDRASVAGRLEWTQVGSAALGLPLMAGGLLLLLTGGIPALAGLAVPATAVGSLLTIAAMALFVALVLRDALALARRHRMLPSGADFDTNSG